MQINDIIKKCIEIPGISIHHTSQNATLILNTDEGKGSMTFFPLFPGLTLAYIFINAPTWPAPDLYAVNEETSSNIKPPLLLNYCISGRCEMVLNSKNFVYVKEKELSLSECFAQSKYVYPLHIYNGIEFFVDIQTIRSQASWILDELYIDFKKIAEIYCPDESTYIETALPEIEEILLKLWELFPQPSFSKNLHSSKFSHETSLTGFLQTEDLRTEFLQTKNLQVKTGQTRNSQTKTLQTEVFQTQNLQTDILQNDTQFSEVPEIIFSQMKLYTLTLFSLLLTQKPASSPKPRTFFTEMQVRIAKEVEKIITADLSKHYPAHQLASKFSISETSLKNYFRGVFGQNISFYLREVRMKKAAELLGNTNLPVSKIAEQVGYMNQSKFAAVFKKQMEMAPLEYRRFVNSDLPQARGTLPKREDSLYL